MLKRIFCLALSLVLLLGVLVQQVTAMEDTTAAEQQITESEQAAVTEEQASTPKGPQIFVDGVVVEDIVPSYYEQTTYVPLRSMALAIRPDATVIWYGSYTEVTAEGLSITVYPNKCYLVANGRYLYLPYGIRYEGGSTMVPIRVLAQALGADVQWDAVTGNINILRGSGAIVSGEEYYDAQDLYWLSHIIYAESGNQPLSGKISVGNVILNRVNNPIFPNSIYGVIFQKNQFTPARNGTINLEPNVESVIAAKLCLDGAVVLPDALWFNRAGLNCWASRNKSYVTTIGGHSFYA